MARPVLLAALLVFTLGCSSWVATADAPASANYFAIQVRQQHLDKVDLLFAIDDSPSMSDKRELLAEALPALVRRLITPDCIANDGSTCSTASDCASFGASARCDTSRGFGICVVPGTTDACPANTAREIKPVLDLHVAVVSSSLGGGGSPDVCTAPAEDAHGRLTGVLPTMQPRDGSGGGFLAWFPHVAENAGKPAPNVTAYGSAPKLLADFGSLVASEGTSGCGLEAQLESWYRFLIQPDPWAEIALDSSNPGAPVAKLIGVDTTLLKMRHDFLRKDSLVGVIQVTDEDDSWSDPLWDGGHGWWARTQSFPGGPGQGAGPRGTSDCDKDANDPDCTSCAFATRTKPVSGTPIAQDPNCTSCAGGLSSCAQKGWYTPQQDGLGARYTDDMRRRYGLDPQWNVQRYIDGLRLDRVPDRDHEVHDPSQYLATQRNCTNPLYASVLPDGSDTSHDALCALFVGPRTPDLVFYVLIGGVPPSQLYDAQGHFKEYLGTADWTALLGGDPHTVESIAPRPGLEAPGASYTLGSDPDHGREWNTSAGALADVPAANVDLQFACTFQLPSPRDCTQASAPCDCAPGSPGATAPDGPPLCDPANRTTQVRGKAYPSTRELRVARGLGAQTTVASICELPGYGFAQAIQGIVNRFKGGDGQCSMLHMPQPDARCDLPCVLLVIYVSQTDQAAGCTDPGMSQPDPLMLDAFHRDWREWQGDAAIATPPPVVCVYRQLLGGDASSLAEATGCSNPSPDYQGIACDRDLGAPPGWCLVMGAANTGGCPFAIEFGSVDPPPGTTLSLECLQTQ